MAPAGRDDTDQRADRERPVASGVETAAFEELYRRHVDATIRFAARRAERPNDVVDLVAAVVLGDLPRVRGRRQHHRGARAISVHRLRRVARGLRVGVQLPEVEREVRWPEYAAMARAAEEVGFDSIWLGDHYLYRYDGRPERGPLEAWTMLAGLAAITERVRLGPLVACLNFHNPAILAKAAATVDELSGGRLTVAVGAGWNRTEFEAFGIPFDHRASRFVESFEIVRRLLDGERLSFEGRFHRVKDAILLPRPSRRPPLMVGSTGVRVLTATLPHVDAWNTWYDWYGNTAEGFGAKIREIDEACERAGRDPATLERSACVLVRLGDTGERPDEPGVTPLQGSLDAIGAGLRTIAEAGADELILVLDPITEASIRALGDVVRQLRAGPDG